ncbi:MAG: hypothetical protein JO162_13535 [Alphaproteobacteria bacterium]|nr:hypothetical protein [Alphaproteobacteria bacterium]
MTRIISLFAASPSRLGSVRRGLTTAALLASLTIFVTPTADAQQQAREPVQQASTVAAIPANPAAEAGAPTAPAVDEVGILILRSDGGDPKELRPDNFGNIIYIARRNGDGRAYRYGRPIEVNPAVKESASQIAAAQFGAPAEAPVALSALPSSAQYALRQFEPSNVTPRILFAHATSRVDTARVSDKLASRLLSLEASANSNRADMVALVKAAMQMFGLKSDVCDNSADERCNEPGVREAFAQIKSEEAQQQRTATATPF